MLNMKLYTKLFILQNVITHIQEQIEGAIVHFTFKLCNHICQLQFSYYFGLFRINGDKLSTDFVWPPSQE